VYVSFDRIVGLGSYSPASRTFRPLVCLFSAPITYSLGIFPGLRHTGHHQERRDAILSSAESLRLLGSPRKYAYGQPFAAYLTVSHHAAVPTSLSENAKVVTSCHGGRENLHETKKSSAHSRRILAKRMAVHFPQLLGPMGISCSVGTYTVTWSMEKKHGRSPTWNAIGPLFGPAVRQRLPRVLVI
jgi:hypothetical protein